MSSTLAPVVLCGAGVSRNAGLPDGQGLARRVLEELWARSWHLRRRRWPAELDSALAWSADREPPLQLELVLELLGRHVPTKTLVGVFTALGGAAPTRDHFLLAMHSGGVVTTNQDLMIEAAALRLGRSTQVLHIHGDLRHPESIVALISQYVIGLKRRVRDDLRDQLRGREVLVAGYSGRDRDVMPYLAEARRVRWRHYVEPGGAAPPLSRQLIELRSVRPGLVSIEHTSRPLAPIEQQVDVRGAFLGPATTALSPGALRAFDALDRRAIDLGLIRVLQRAKAHDLARRSLAALARDPGPWRGAVEQALGNATADRRPRGAERHFRRAAHLAVAPEDRAAAELGVASIASNRSDYAAADAALGRALQAGEQARGAARDRIVGRVLARAARMHVMTDQEGRSMREYRRALAAARRCGDIDTLVDALTFGSDPWRSRGRYADALAMLDEARSDAEMYARPTFAGWLPFYVGNCLGAMHELDAAQAELDRCCRLARAMGNVQLEGWAEVLRCCYHRADDLSAARHALRRARRAVDRLGHCAFALEARIAFEAAELLRSSRQWKRCRAAASALYKAVARQPQRMPYLEAHIAALGAELARDRTERDAVALIRVARRRYRDGHWEHGVARMDLSLWLNTGGTPSPQLVARCSQRSFNFELLHMQGAPAMGYVPLLVV